VVDGCTSKLSVSVLATPHTFSRDHANHLASGDDFLPISGGTSLALSTAVWTLGHHRGAAGEAGVC
jgi:hypothetical protein